MKAIGYIRVSTEGQATEGVSLDAQSAKIRAYCELNDLGVRQRFVHFRDISPQSHLWQDFDNQPLKVRTTKLNA
jgi:hypothetical protein